MARQKSTKRSGKLTLLDARFTRIERDDAGRPRFYSIPIYDHAGVMRVPHQTERLDLVGTAEAAELLDVERPRIGRWIAKGDMPMPVVWLASGPVWQRADVAALRDEVDARRRLPSAA